MNPEKPMKAVIYCRVSDRRQEKDGDGLGSQEACCLEYAHNCGYTYVRTFKETLSGGRDDRPVMKELLAFLRRQKEPYVVIIDHLNRLARDLEVYRKYRRLIAKAGGVLESPSFRFGTKSHDLFTESVTALGAEFVRLQNGEQVRDRMRGRTLKGFWAFTAPIGYKYVGPVKKNKDLVPDEPRASIIREALEGFASGRFATQAEVQRFLESQECFPKDQHGKVHRERVRDIMTRLVYTGYIEVPNWNIPLMKGKHPPIISYETYQRVQTLLTGNRRLPARKDFNEDFILRGHVLCADCDQPFRASWTKGRSSHYAY